MPVDGCELTIGGKAGAVDDVLTRVEFSESLDRLDSLVAFLELPMGYEERADLLKSVKPGTTWKLAFGDRTVTGDVVSVRWAYSIGNVERWTIEGLEPLHRARILQWSETTEDQKQTVVEALIKKTTAKASVEAVGAGARPLFLLDESALALIKRLAVERNFALHVEKQTVKFGPRNATAKTVKLKFEDLGGIDLQADLVDMPTTVEVQGYDYVADEKPPLLEAKDADLAKISGGDLGTKLRKDAWGVQKVIVHEPFGAVAQTDVKDRAVGELQRAAERFVTGEFFYELESTLYPSVEVLIENAPWPYGGPWRVRAAQHTFGPGTQSESRVEFFSDSLPKSS